MTINEKAYNKIYARLVSLKIDKEILTNQLDKALLNEDEHFIEFEEANLHNCNREIKINEYILNLIENDRKRDAQIS